MIKLFLNKQSREFDLDQLICKIDEYQIPTQDFWNFWHGDPTNRKLLYLQGIRLKRLDEGIWVVEIGEPRLPRRQPRQELE
jgi:hypothetical protein